MESEIKVELKGHANAVDTFIAVFGMSIVMVWCPLLAVYFSVGSLIGFILVCIGVVIYLFFYFTHSAVVVVDSRKLMYKRLFISVTILLADIDRISCEPYFVHSRYHASQQRIQLTIYTRDDELKLSDRVDTNALLSDILKDIESDIPIIRLYRFLMKETGRA